MHVRVIWLARLVSWMQLSWHALQCHILQCKMNLFFLQDLQDLPFKHLLGHQEGWDSFASQEPFPWTTSHETSKVPTNICLEMEAKGMLQMTAPKKLVSKQLEKESLKAVTLKDIGNIGAKGKRKASHADIVL